MKMGSFCRFFATGVGDSQPAAAGDDQAGLQDVGIVECGGDAFARIFMAGESLDLTLELIEIRVAVGGFGQDIPPGPKALDKGSSVWHSLPN